jgi:predicted transcriptional regulator
MPKTQIATRVDDTLKQRIDDYADRHDVTKAEAQRHLLSRGIDYEEGRLATGGDGDRGDAAGDWLIMAQNMAAFGSASAGMALGIILAVIAVFGIGTGWWTMMLTTAVASVACGGAVVWLIARTARSSAASWLGLQQPDGVDR